MDLCLTRRARGLPPIYTALPMASAYAAVHGATSVCLALINRKHTDLGDVFEVPLASALQSGMGLLTMQVEDLPDRYGDPTFGDLDPTKKVDDFETWFGENTDPLYTDYLCADGRKYFFYSDGHQRLPKQVLKVLELWEEFVSQGLPMEDPYHPKKEWANSSNLWVLNGLPVEWRCKLMARLKVEFAKHSSHEWMTKMGDGGAAGTSQQSTHERMASDHAIESGLVTHMNHPDYGFLKVAGPHIWFDDGSPLSPKP